jgi:hypothetical protein
MPAPAAQLIRQLSYQVYSLARAYSLGPRDVTALTAAAADHCFSVSTERVGFSRTIEELRIQGICELVVTAPHQTQQLQLHSADICCNTSRFPLAIDIM